MRPREKAVPLALLCCGCAAFAALALLRECDQAAAPAPAPAPVEPPDVTSTIILGFAVLGALAWVPAGILLVWKGIKPAKGASTRAGLFEVAGSVGLFLLVITTLEAAIDRVDGPLSAHMAAFAAAQGAAVGYVWFRLRAFPAAFEKPLRNLLSGAAVYLLISPFVIAATVLNVGLVEALGLEPQAHPAAQELATHISTPEMVVILVLGAAVAPLVEELLFRGIVYGALRRRLAPWAAAAFSGAVFAAIHVQPGQFLPLFVLGVALALVYEQTGSLAASVGLHAANNTVALAAIIAARLYVSQGG